MENFSKTELGKEFKPSLKFKKLYFIYFSIVLFLGILSWYLPVIVAVFLFGQLEVKIVFTLISLGIIAVFVFTAYWIPKYYASIVYKMNQTEITWDSGVWFKKSALVPYNRITNISVKQGPISRKLGIASLHVETAGFSGASSSGGSEPELKLDGVENFLEIRDKIMEIVRGKKPMAVETYETLEEDSIVKELIKIRELLEEKLQ